MNRSTRGIEAETLAAPEGKCRGTRIPHDPTNFLDVVVLTHFASPYQVELFDETARRLGEGFAVYYLHRSASHSQLEGNRSKAHSSLLQ